MVVTKISCTSCFRAPGNETKTVFQDFSTWPQLGSAHTDVLKEGTRVHIRSHTGKHLERGIICTHRFYLKDAHRIFHFKKKNWG